LGKTVEDLLRGDGTESQVLPVTRGSTNQRLKRNRCGKPRCCVVAAKRAAEPMSGGFALTSDLSVGLLRVLWAGVVEEGIGGGEPEPPAEYHPGEGDSSKASGQSDGFHTRGSIRSAPRS
jgi:hypothetical protein